MTGKEPALRVGAGPVSGGISPWAQKLPGPGESLEMKMGFLGLSHRESWNGILVGRDRGRRGREEGEERNRAGEGSRTASN